MRTVWRGPCGRKMTEILGTALTEIVTAETAGANPGAETVTRYAPGGIPSRRNSPSGLLVAVRLSGDSSCSTVIVAPATRAPLASSTIPTSAPSAFCAAVAGPLHSSASSKLAIVLMRGCDFFPDMHRLQGSGWLPKAGDDAVA